MIIVIVVACLFMFSVSVIFAAWILRNQEKRMQMEFETKMEMAKAQSLMKDNATFEQLRTDINYIITFFVFNDFPFITNGLEKEPESREQLIEQFVSSVAAKTLISMSDEMTRQFGLYASIPTENMEGEDFLSYFIRKETFTKVIARLEMKR